MTTAATPNYFLVWRLCRDDYLAILLINWLLWLRRIYHLSLADFICLIVAEA
ncbi:hypothetical protein [Nostoc sp. UHCC 0870]|uniref:hypothetical protein n=1 Tax=Nostoc sp. UHCC 0870 TaxID=2914041 RepID=UPI0030DD6F40